MVLRKPTLFALAIGMSLLGSASMLTANEQSGEFPAYEGTAEWIPPPQPYIPGPGWFTEPPGLTYPPAPPAADNWNVSYPYKYFPQPNPNVGGPVFDPSFLPAELADLCFCTPPPCYLGTFYLDVVALSRHANLESTDVIFNPALQPIVSTSDLSLDLEAGVRLGLLLPSPSGNDWIFEYFGINAFQDSITRSDPAGLSDVFFGTRGFANALTMEYESKLDSLEFTMRSRQTRRLAPMAGIRYIRIAEELNDIAADNSGWYSDTDNDLFGFHFGCQALICQYGLWRMETTVRAGPFINDVDVDVIARNQQGAQITRHVDHWQTSFVGDWRVGLVWQAGPRMAFRMGYQGLWIEGLALGPNQVNNVSFATGLESVDMSGAIYQGGYLGFDLSW